MTHIEQMIQDMCPNGVEFKTLGEVEKSGLISMGRGNVISKDDMKNTPGDYPVYSSSSVGNGEIGRYGLYMFDDERITWSIDGGGKFFYRNNHKYSVTNVGGWIKVLREDIITTKFLYYILIKEWTNKVYDYNHKAHPSVIREEYEIPLPPIEMQKKIVECLDKFSALAAELQAELQLRRKQYEYYRTQLLTPHSDCNSADNTDDRNWECQRYTKGIAKVYDWQWKTLGEVCEIGTGSHNTQDGLIEGDFPFYTRGTEILRLNSYDFDEAAIITAGDGAGVGKVFHYVQGKYALHQRAYRIIADRDHLLPRFLYHYMRYSFYDYIMKTSVSSSVTSVRKPMLEAYPIPLPPLAEQARIVAILDKFEALTTSLSDGIPAEQAAQQKRYEYYRDKLLTFPVAEK